MEKPKHIIKFVGIDSWSRPVFKLLNKKYYYGSVNILFDHGVTEADVKKQLDISKIVFFGTKFDCEPDGSAISNTQIQWTV